MTNRNRSAQRRWTAGSRSNSRTGSTIRSSKSNAAHDRIMLLVARVDLRGLDVVVVGRVRQVVVRADERVLGQRDPGQQRLDVVAAVAVVQRAHRLAHRAELIGLVVDREAARQAERLALGLQDLEAERVERADRELAHGRAVVDQAGDALAHLGRGLVGERHRADRLRRDAQRQQVRDPVRDHAGLARAGAGEHQQRPAAVARRLALRRIELAEIDHERCTLRIRARGVNAIVRAAATPATLRRKDAPGHRYDALVDALRAEFPEFRIVRKDRSRLHRAIHHALRLVTLGRMTHVPRLVPDHDRPHGLRHRRLGRPRPPISAT